MSRGDGDGGGVGVGGGRRGGAAGRSESAGKRAIKASFAASLARVPGGRECSAPLVVFLPILQVVLALLLLLALGARLLAPRL